MSSPHSCLASQWPDGEDDSLWLWERCRTQQHDWCAVCSYGIGCPDPVILDFVANEGIVWLERASGGQRHKLVLSE